MRICGDMSWVHKEPDVTAKLIKYESLLYHGFPEAMLLYLFDYLFFPFLSFLFFYYSSYVCMTRDCSKPPTCCKYYPPILKLSSMRSFFKIFITCLFLLFIFLFSFNIHCLFYYIFLIILFYKKGHQMSTWDQMLTKQCWTDGCTILVLNYY